MFFSMKKITLFFAALFVAMSAFATKIYFKPDSYWTNNNAWFAVWYWGDNTNGQWANMTESEVTGIYVTEIENPQNLIFVSMKDGKPADWNNKENNCQTNNLKYDGTNNLYTIEGMGGSWSIFDSNSQGEEPTPIVLYPTNTTIYVTVHSQWATDNARFAAYFFGVNGDIWTDMTNVKELIYSLNVPAGEWNGMIICRMNPNNTENRWNNDGEENGPFWGMQTIDIVYEEGKNHYIINSEDQTLDGNKPGGFWTTYKANDTTTTLENTTIANIYTQNGMIVADEEISIFTITGQNVTNLNGKLENGVYIVKSANATTKVVVK